MNFENSILEALKAGKTVDELASEYSKALNEAIKLKEAEEAKAKEAESVKKIEDMNEILDLIDEFIVNYYPEYKDMVGNVESKDMIELLDETFPLIKKLNKGLEDFVKILEIDKEDFVCCKPEKTAPFHKISSKDALSAKDVDKVLNDFMKKMGL